ncbi:MAG: GTPase HflX [Proteobacteria bacterium]|nr:GTPase HflX [Pseudomonadota bacterium]
MRAASRGTTTSEVTGNTNGLRASTVRAIERIFRRRVRPTEVVSGELATYLCRLSHELHRQIGVLIDRRGQPEHVVVGDASKLWLPDIGRLRAGHGRLRGLRLVHTHLRGEELSNDDLTDLALLRLDLVCALTFAADGQPTRAYCAHLNADAAAIDPWTVLPAVAAQQLTLDPLALVQALEGQFARQSAGRTAAAQGERAILVHLGLERATRTPAACIAELKELCRTAGVSVLDTVVQRRSRADPRYAVGRGKLEQIVLRANQLGAELLVFDTNLTPTQARAISEATELKVIDRAMLILDIFAQHAQTSEGRLQVEAAQLRYMMPRLVEKNTMMSRLTGGIGGRGPGETKLEINRRRARERVTRLNRQLAQLSAQRQRRRALREARELPIISIVGYTNAGKSTLLNVLTNSDAVAADQLFATLSPLSRRLRFPREREVICTDTVGFIHDLPQEVIEAFRATLEELRNADLLLQLVDVSDDDFRAHITTVQKTLAELEVGDTPRLLVFNKVDRLDPDELAARLAEFQALPISALQVEGCRGLLEAVAEALWREGKPIAQPAAISTGV